VGEMAFTDDISVWSNAMFMKNVSSVVAICNHFHISSSNTLFWH